MWLIQMDTRSNSNNTTILDAKTRTAAGEGNALIAIRDEHPADVAGIRELNKRAFGQDQEANLVDALRSHGAVLLSLVATLGGTSGLAKYRPEFSSVS